MFDLSSILTSIISLAVFAIVWIIGNKLKPWLATVIPTNSYNFLTSIANAAVLAVEAQFKDIGGKNKFNEAMDRVLELLEGANLTFSKTAITDAIESAWMQMTMQQNATTLVIEDTIIEEVSSAE